MSILTAALAFLKIWLPKTEVEEPEVQEITFLWGLNG